MTTKENARWQAGAECNHAVDSTPTIRQRVQVSAQLACTFVATFEPLRVDIHWHGKANPSRMGGLAMARYRRARDAFLERLAMGAGQTWAVVETGSNYVRALGLASCDPRGHA